MIQSWLKLVNETTLLALEAQVVIGARLTQIAFARGTLAETQLMFTEKAVALLAAAETIARGGSARRVVKGYRKRVGANVRRLKR